MALTLGVLGPLDVCFAHTAVALPAKAQALLVYLAFAERPVRREFLADMFWGETGEGSARANLRLALLRLRQALPGLIAADAQSVSLHAEMVADVDALALLRVATLTPRPPADVLQEAIERYRGTFLQDFVLRDCPDFEDWAATQRSRIDRHAAVVLRELVQAARARGDALAERHCLLRWADLAADDPALALAMGAAPASPVSSPAPAVNASPALDATSLFGRARELHLIGERLAQGERLVMLLGPPGVGKSRLARAVAQEAAARYPHGAVTCHFDFLDPAASMDASRDHFVAALGTALGLDFSQTVQPAAMLMEHLHTLRAVLCLDGLETCAAAAPMVSQVLEAASQCLLLVTSRSWLPLAAGWAHELRGLDTEAAAGAQAPAVRMLAACAHDAGVMLDEAGDREQLLRLARLLDGSPLAIQFAAQSLALYSPTQLADRLETGSWPEAPRNLPGYRHQRLSDVMAEAWDHLGPDLQSAWARCALFQGTFTLSWAVECTGAAEPHIAALRDRFVLGREPDGRLRMHELTRQYGLAMLARQPDADAHRRRFARTALARLVQLLPALRDVDAAVVDLLKPEISTLASAFEMALQWESPGDIDEPLQALARAYYRLGWQYAAVTVLESALARHAQADPAWRMAWHRMAGEAARSLYGYQRADVHFKKTVQLGGAALVRGRWKPWFAGLRASATALLARPLQTPSRRNAQRMLAQAICEMLRPRYLNGAPLTELLAGVAQAWLAARRSGSTDARLTVMLRLLRFLPADIPSVVSSRLMQGIRNALAQVDPVHRAYATLECGLIMVNQGAWDDAASRLNRASQSLAALGDGYHALEAMTESHPAQAHTGDFRAAALAVDATIARARQTNQPSVLRWMLLTRLQLWLRTGSASAGQWLACLAEVHTIPAFKSPVEELSVRGHDSLLACSLGQPDGVVDHAQAVLRIAGRMAGSRFHVLTTMAMTLDAVMALSFAGGGDPRLRELAPALARRFGALARHMGIFGPRRLLYAGQAQALRGRPRAAIAAWRRGLALTTGRRLDYDAARLRWMLALYLGGDEAAGHAHEARALFEQCGVAQPWPFVPAARN